MSNLHRKNADTISQTNDGSKLMLPSSKSELARPLADTWKPWSVSLSNACSPHKLVQSVLMPFRCHTSFSISTPGWLFQLLLSSFSSTLLLSYWITNGSPMAPVLHLRKREACVAFLQTVALANTSDAMTLCRNKFTAATVRHELPKLWSIRAPEALRLDCFHCV